MLQNLIMCTDVLPNVPASAHTYFLHSQEVKNKITLCSDLSTTLDKSRPFNDHSQSRLVYSSPKFEHIFGL